MAFIRKIKKGNSVYLALVENYREDGKVKQRHSVFVKVVVAKKLKSNLGRRNLFLRRLVP